MTNKERLDNLTEKVNELTETLNNKILALDIGTRTIEVELPEIFVGSTSIMYAHVITKDKVLFTTAVDNSGLWLYKISDKTWTQIYTSGREFRYKHQISDNLWFINSSQVLVYNSDTDECTVVGEISGGYCEYIYKVDGKKWLIANTNGYGILLYDENTNSSERIYTSGRGWKNAQQISEYEWFISSDDSYYPGILRYNGQTNEITKVYDVGRNYKYIYKIQNEKWLLCSPVNTNGISVYDSKTDSFSLIYNVGGHITSDFVFIFKDKVFISYSYGGLIIYDVTTNEAVFRDEIQKYSWSMYHAISNKIFISGAVGASGLWCYDYDTDTLEQVVSTGSQYEYYYTIKDRLFISGDDAGAKGIYLYDSTTKEFNQIHTQSYRWSVFTQIDENTVLIGSASGTGILQYDYVTNSLTLIYSSSVAWIYPQKVTNDKYLIGSGAVNGLVRYDAITKTAKQIFPAEGYYDVFEVDGVNCYIKSTNKSSKGILYYSSINDNCIRVGYKIEV